MALNTLSFSSRNPDKEQEQTKSKEVKVGNVKGSGVKSVSLTDMLEAETRHYNTQHTGGFKMAKLESTAKGSATPNTESKTTEDVAVKGAATSSTTPATAKAAGGSATPTGLRSKSSLRSFADARSKAGSKTSSSSDSVAKSEYTNPAAVAKKANTVTTSTDAPKGDKPAAEDEKVEAAKPDDTKTPVTPKVETAPATDSKKVTDDKSSKGSEPAPDSESLSELKFDSTDKAESTASAASTLVSIPEPITETSPHVTVSMIEGSYDEYKAKWGELDVSCGKEFIKFNIEVRVQGGLLFSGVAVGNEYIMGMQYGKSFAAMKFDSEVGFTGVNFTKKDGFFYYKNVPIASVIY